MKVMPGYCWKQTSSGIGEELGAGFNADLILGLGMLLCAGYS